jgi:hypothetical protein
MAGSVYEEKLEREVLPNNPDHLFARLSQWQFLLQGNQLKLIGRAYLLFITIPQKLLLNYSFEEKMREYFNIGAFDFMATGLTIWMKSDGYENDLLTMDIPNMKNIATDNNQRMFLQLSSGTPESYRRALRGEQWKEPDLLADYYGLDPLYLMPAIVIDRSDNYRSGAFVVPQLYYLLERAANGVFFLLADREQQLAKTAGQPDRNPFRVAFGAVYRQYVKLQLSQSLGNSSIIDLDEDFGEFSGKIPDFALIENGVCVLIEVKTNLLNIRARSYFEPAILHKEIKKGVFDKAVRQLHEFGQQILTGQIINERFTGVTRVIKLLVGYDDIFTLNTLLLSLLAEHYGQKASDLQLASISDIEAMGILVAQNDDLVQWIIDKVDDPREKYHSFIADLDRVAKIKNPLLKKSFNDLLERMAGRIV